MSEQSPVANSQLPVVEEPKPLTGMDVYERMKKAYARFSKYSKRALAHELASLAYIVLAADETAFNKRVDEFAKSIAGYEDLARSERINDSLKRLDKQLEAGTWQRPKKRRRRRARRLTTSN